MTAPLLVVFVLAASYAAGRAASDQTPAGQPTFRTEANYVRVDIYPTRNGVPVTDLARDDFEILENGQVQSIEQFERVQIRAAGPQESRIEPNTVAASRAMLESSRARVLVLFLDTYHVDVAASHRIRQPLVDALDRVVGADDLIGVMTPEMSPNDIAFARKTATIDGMLARYWHWGERDAINAVDPEDEQYAFCYPDYAAGSRCADQNGIAAAMIDRRHEKRTLDALQDLVRSLRGVREERKAVLAISNGWLMYRPDRSLMRPLRCQGVPAGAGVAMDPPGRRPMTPNAPAPRGSNSCDIDRTNLAQIDDDRTFREILDEANRANASFYPIDPRGLAAFDTPLMRQGVSGPAAPVTPPAVDSAMLAARLDSLQTLAGATDGLAIVNSNNLEGGLHRVVNDLSSYYLLGYYSTGRLDGKFHSIAVRIKRPGVQVRARRGYLAATAAEATRTARDAAAAPTPADAEALAIEAALSPLSSFSRETSLRFRAAAGWSAGRPRIWLVGELGPGDPWKLGAEAEMTLSTEGEALANAHATVPPGARTFEADLVPQSALGAGDYTISVRTRATSMLAMSSDVVPLPLPPPPASYGSLLVRRGPFTGLKEVPTADLRFRRSEQLRVEVPAPADDVDRPAARLLDRTGKPMPVPLAAAARTRADGSRWYTAQVPLVPLGPGDYLVEISWGGQKMLTPFRMVN